MVKPTDEWVANWRLLGLGLSMLGLLVAGPIVGWFIGDWLARKLGAGWLTWVCLVIGFAAAGRQIYLIARRIQQEAQD